MTATSPTTQTDTQSAFMLMANRDLLSVILLGGVIGIATWGLSWLLGSFVYDAILCSGGDTCRANPDEFGEITAVAITAIAALIALVRLRVFRPMLVVIAVTASLWGLMALLSPLEWYWTMLAGAAVYAVAYGLFVWTVRIRRFWIALILVLLLIVAIRYIMTV